MTRSSLANCAAVGAASPPFDVSLVRADFPILKQQVRGKPLVYLDNAATTQKPQAVIDAVANFYCSCCSNVHRGLYLLSERATEAYEQARAKVAQFITARDVREIIFVRGATEAINLVAQSYGTNHLRPGDEIVISTMEHHSNIVPWQLLCEQRGAVLRVVPITDDGEFQMEQYQKLLGPKTRFVAVSHLSNALGTVNPVRKIIELAHQQDVPVLVDGAQAVPHLRVDVEQLDCDFYVFSGHKLYGPTGIGVLYGKSSLLDAMPPYQGGGEMIRSVSFEKTTYNDLPYKFEAGTPNVAGAIGLGTAIDYVNQIELDAAAAYEQQLLAYATVALSEIPGVRLIGTAPEKASIVSFVMDRVHPHDISTILDREGIAIRAGHHCAQPLMKRYGVPATARASLAFYNTTEEIDAVVEAIHKVKEIFG